MQPFGCRIRHRLAAGLADDLDGTRTRHSGSEQVVLESDPYRRLSYTWHTFTPEWAESVGVGTETLERLAAEQRSRVTFEITPADDMVRLTVVHDGFEPGSTAREMIQEGWPALLSAL